MTCVSDSDRKRIMVSDLQGIVSERLADMAYLCAEGYHYSQHLDPDKVRQMGANLRVLERACGIQRVAA